jgi:hypothetical protein
VPAARRRREVRNELVTTWRHRRGVGLLGRTGALVAGAASDGAVLRGVLDAFRISHHVLRHRRPVPMSVERQLRRLERSSHAGRRTEPRRNDG